LSACLNNLAAVRPSFSILSAKYFKIAKLS
jgi:hypothetical protein